MSCSSRMTSSPSWKISCSTVVNVSGPVLPTLSTERAREMTLVAGRPMRSGASVVTRPPANIRRRPGPGGAGIPTTGCPSSPNSFWAVLSSRYIQCHIGGTTSPSPKGISIPSMAASDSTGSAAMISSRRTVVVMSFPLGREAECIHQVGEVIRLVQAVHRRDEGVGDLGPPGGKELPRLLPHLVLRHPIRCGTLRLHRAPRCSADDPTVRQLDADGRTVRQLDALVPVHHDPVEGCTDRRFRDSWRIELVKADAALVE